MNLADKRTIEKLLNENGFSFKKSLGQNFLIDGSVCPRMAQSAADDQTGVLEIGPGFGVLTAECARVAKRVVTVELDRRVEPVLNQTLREFDNIKVIFGDAMKLDLAEIIKENFSDCKKVAVCANLPYYITSPLIMRLLYAKLPIDNITVMVQKEAAERLSATVGSRDAGAVSVAVQYFSKPEILFHVSKNSFMPAPKVDSAVIKLNILKEPPVKVADEGFFMEFTRACFAQRRKTLANTVCNTLGINKSTLYDVLSTLGLESNVRGESLTLDELARLVNLIKG